MAASPNSTFGPRAALAYLTGGALLCVWTLVWYFTRDHAIAHSQWFWIAGLFFSGVTLVFLGLILGPLGRLAPQAELPHADALRLEAAIEHLAATHSPVVVVPPSAPANESGRTVVTSKPSVCRLLASGVTT
jgi:hypothetical protein